MSTSPEPVVFKPHATFKSVACGDHFSAAISTSGDLYTWGRHDFLQLGYSFEESNTTPSAYPTGTASKKRTNKKSIHESRLGVGGSPFPRIVLSLANSVASVSIGTDHVCAIDTKGQLYTWGRGTFSQLGLGDSTDRIEPCAVPGMTAPARSVSAGWRFTVCVCEDGQVYSWGAGSAGQLGHESKLRKRVATPIKTFENMSDTIKLVSCGEKHVFALTESGVVYAWGSNEHGRLGIGDKDCKEKTTPYQMPPHPQAKIVDIHAGHRHSACLDAMGRMYTWGCGGNGRLGHGISDDQYTPKQVLSKHLTKRQRVKSIQCGHMHTSAIDETGKLFLWGCGNSGRLGQGAATAMHEDKVRPIPVIGDRQYMTIAAGANHNIALLPDGNMVSWGALGSVSNKGQLGPTALDYEMNEKGDGKNAKNGKNEKNGKTGNDSNNRETKSSTSSDDIFAAFTNDISDSDSSGVEWEDEDDDMNGNNNGNNKGNNKGNNGNNGNNGNSGKNNGEVVHGVRLAKTSSTLHMRVRAPPTITDPEILAEGGADPHPALRTPASEAAYKNGSSTTASPGQFTPRPGSNGTAHRQAAFPTEFSGETDLTHLGAIKVHTPSRAMERAEARKISSGKKGSIAIDLHPDVGTPDRLVGLHTPRPTLPSRSLDKNMNNNTVSETVSDSANFPPGLEGLTLNMAVHTPSVAITKAQQNKSRWGDGSPTLESLAEPNDDGDMVDGYEVEDDVTDASGFGRNVFVADGSPLSVSNVSNSNSTTTTTTTSNTPSNNNPTALNGGTHGERQSNRNLDTIDRSKLQSALNKTMRNFTDHKFLTIIGSMTSALSKQHSLVLARVLSTWRMSTLLDRVRSHAMSTIRDVKLGYDLLGSRMMYRMLNTLSRRLLRRGWHRFTYNMLVGRATGRALDSTSDARIFLEERVQKLKEIEKTMKQRLQYHRNVMKDRLMKTTIRYGRDKLYHVLRMHQQHSLRDAFSTWSLRSHVNEQVDRLRRGRLKLQVGRDQLIMKKDRIVGLEKDLLEKSRKFDVFIAFQKWIQLKQRKDHEEQISILKQEREYMIQELTVIDGRINELNASSEEAENVKRQRGGLVIHALDNFSDTLAHEVVKMRSM